MMFQIQLIGSLGQVTCLSVKAVGYSLRANTGIQAWNRQYRSLDHRTIDRTVIGLVIVE